ncbi:carbohydrate ABC transporter permease [Ensifer sp. ENS09]|uniref:carbohydrate ABC transporter permease n=1 Tax=Ensifer sp. ENS09 TaxID=2769263 RepID=UPI00177ABB28|nr:carbohydrate ABC transporter permease [Ensifer sp. ENS09]MBD9650107.1 carbohydrate ABC transporter permease [Ensifer sp. ENS09]
MNTKALRPGFGLNLAVGLFVAFWAIIAAFPLVWIAIMSFRVPIDAFATDPLQVIFGDVTLQRRGGISLLAIAAYILVLCCSIWLPRRHGAALAKALSFRGARSIGLLAAWLLYVLLLGAAVYWVIPAVIGAVEALISPLPVLGAFAKPLFGLTTEHYQAVWIKHGFYHQFLNSMLVTFGVVTISLSVGTLAGYALARANSNLAFWLLIAALIFRALPHSVLVTGYLPPFINSREILMPLWNWPPLAWFFHLFSEQPPTLYGQPLAVIMVLVSINQPFTIWMLRSFFQNIPAELDEAARVDGCTYFEAFWRVIMPVMWPGVITTGLFSFLLAYNDYLVTSLLLDAQSQTMVPAIAQYFNRETTTTDQIEAVAAAVSITAPLFLLVMVFQRQIVSGLTQGAVKG